MAKSYKAYMFKTYDPAMRFVILLMQREGETPHSVEKKGGPTASCSRAWEKKKTKRPQNATVEAFGRAMGYKRKWVKS